MSTRAAIIGAALGSALLAIAPAWMNSRPRFLWNASASVPIGLYRVQPASGVGVSDIAVVMPPRWLAGFLAERGYLPQGVLLLKHVLASGGQTVCRRGDAIIVLGVTIGTARRRDGRGRALPVWQGCRFIGGDEVFLMNRDAADSFDSRYFGPLPVASIVGRAVPVWTVHSSSSAPDMRAKRSRRSGGPDPIIINANQWSSALAQIGTFTRNDDGFFGNISTLALEAKVEILPAVKSDVENATDHRVFCEGMEIGAPWDRTGEKAGAYLSASFDDPSFARPIRASLFRSDVEKSVWVLHWSRQPKRDDRD